MENIRQLKHGLIQQTESLVKALFSGRYIQYHGNEYRIGNKGSLCVSLDGCYYDHEQGEGGDLLHLIQQELRCDFKSALDFAESVAGSYISQPILHVVRDQKRKQQRTNHEQARIQRAMKMWNEAQPIAGTPAEQYLNTRGIMLCN